MASVEEKSCLTDEQKYRSHSDIRTMADEAQCDQRNGAGTDMSSTSLSSTEKIKRTRVGLTARHKREICLYKQFNPKATQENLVQFCKDRWNLPAGRTTLGEILRQKDKWLSITPDQEEMRRSRGGRHNKLEMELFKWISAQRKMDPSSTISDQMIIEHAKSIGEELNIDQSFSYSNGWLFKFKKRHGIKSKGTTGRFQILEDCYNDRNPGVAFNRRFPDCSGSETMQHGTQNMFTNIYDSGYTNESGMMDQSHFYSTYMHMYGQKETVNDNSQQSQPIFPSAVPTEMIIKEECISDNENSNDYDDVNDADESANSVQNSAAHSPLLQLECENETQGVPVAGRLYMTKGKETLECPNPQKRPHRAILPISTKRIITASEAKHGALMCIRYVEQHPELGEHLDALWEAHDDIETHHEGVMSKQKTITEYFCPNRARSDDN